MLQKGIIEKLEGKYAARVRVPKYDKMVSSDNGTDTKDLPIGIVCALPEMKITYSVGDVVLVAYENDELSKPVILGLLYRDSESDSTSELPYIEDTLSEINDKLSTLEDQDMYMHVKYSNDNGATFTSLFDYSNIAEDEVGFYVYSPTPIEIDPTTELVQWNIINSDNVDVTSNFVIETAIDGVNSKTGKDIHDIYKDPLFKPQVLTKACDTVTISFNIKATKEILSNYYISLSTENRYFFTFVNDVFFFLPMAVNFNIFLSKKFIYKR